MTFWDLIYKVFAWGSDHTSQLLSSVLIILSTLVGGNVIPEGQLKYYVVAIAILQGLRAQWISSTVTAAKTIVANSSLTPSQISATELPKNVNAQSGP
jgi:hypothetical protein